MHQYSRQVVALVILSTASATWTGCTTAVGCPGWVGYSTPDAALKQAPAVVRGHVQEQVGSEPLNGGTANVWAVEVDEWMKGSGEPLIWVISPPSACGASDDPYFGPDPFETATAFDDAVMFLIETDAGWMAVNPSQGVIEPTADGSLPSSWPEDSQ